MIIVVDDRDIVIEGYTSLFGREGITTTGFTPADFGEWMESVSQQDVMAVEAFLIGECATQNSLPARIRERCKAPVIAVNDRPTLEHTLELFQSGVDDVVRKPVHVREILARINAIRRRAGVSVGVTESGTELGPIRVFSDGRDPQINGVDFPLPRRERRILEYLIANRGRRLNKGQIFSAIYGIFDSEVEENVVESHISKLRKKLRERLGFDPVDSKRFLGYCINIE
ncbi:two-component system response regulator [Falsochrobactrum shanghaiense]|uniref:Flagellar transcriptional regulator FtcR n=1 Tax=Falsochrobactrum shanghaiense TaxID=2201899 RepID=A0A316JQ02_9HYPH|nr:response regulator transcription factor [Falsochrobactrum shanghaiense]PWL17310.1 two-component system response regulator [Falsochrobactrum shanghaiense]